MSVSPPSAAAIRWMVGLVLVLALSKLLIWSGWLLP